MRWRRRGVGKTKPTFVMNTNRRKKIALFNKFSTNLVHVQNHLRFKFQEKFHNQSIYVCPLSFKIFTREGLDNSFDDQLTAEHAPPESLNGKTVALTTKLLNNESGHSQDIKLLNYIKTKEFAEGCSPIETKFKINNDFSLKGSIAKKEHLEFVITTKNFHEGAKRFMELFDSQKLFNVNFSLPNLRGCELTFLRTAYILAFSQLGYSYLFGGSHYINPNSEIIRKQLFYPDKKIIPFIPIIKEDFPDEFLGTNIISYPNELKSLLVIFDLKVDKKNHRYGVILPGPDAHGFKAYKWFSEFDKNKKITFDAHLITDSLDLTTLEGSIRFLKAWEAFNGIEKT